MKCPHCGKDVKNIVNGWDEISEVLGGINKRTAMELDCLPVAKIGGMVMSTRNALEAYVLENISARKRPTKKRRNHKLISTVTKM